MNFYETFCFLCKEKGVARGRAVLDAGLSKSTAYKWAKNPDIVPEGATLTKLCNYFAVEPSYFLKSERSTAVNDDASLRFDYLRGLLTPEEKAQVSDYIEFLLQRR